MGPCGCKKRQHPIQQQSASNKISLTEVKKEEPAPLTEDEKKLVQEIVKEIKKQNEQPHR